MNILIKKLLPEPFRISVRRLLRSLRPVNPDERVNFDVYSVNDGHFKVKYRGISCIRCPFDYVIYQMIVSEIKPDLVIEIGTNYGGTSLYIADLMDKIGHGTIHTIDIDDHADKLVRDNPRIKRFLEGWQGYNIDQASSYKNVLVIEDGSHTYQESLDALKKFAPLVSRHSYYIVEDGIVSALGRDRGFGGGPLRAIREFLPNHPEFKVDRELCDMFGKNATFNVNGYLKKIL